MEILLTITAIISWIVAFLCARDSGLLKIKVEHLERMDKHCQGQLNFYKAMLDALTGKEPKFRATKAVLDDGVARSKQRADHFEKTGELPGIGKEGGE